MANLLLNRGDWLVDKFNGALILLIGAILFVYGSPASDFMERWSRHVVSREFIALMVIAGGLYLLLATDTHRWFWPAILPLVYIMTVHSLYRLQLSDTSIWPALIQVGYFGLMVIDHLRRSLQRIRDHAGH